MGLFDSCPMPTTHFLCTLCLNPRPRHVTRSFKGQFLEPIDETQASHVLLSRVYSLFPASSSSGTCSYLLGNPWRQGSLLDHCSRRVYACR